MITGDIIPGYDPPSSGDGPAATDARPPPLEPSHAERARTIVAGQGRPALSTLSLDAAGMSFGSVISYGLAEAGRPSFFVSTMAEHNRNLDADPRASVLVVERPPGTATADADPLASGRVTLVGEVAEITDAASGLRPVGRRRPVEELGANINWAVHDRAG